MWFFSNIFSKSTPLDLAGITDWHSHILPGVDDGVEDMETSLAILDDYDKAGVTNVWLTPHIMEDIPNTTDKLKTRFDELVAAYTGNVTLHLAAENMIDNLFEERLSAGDVLTIGNDSKTLLVETSYYTPPLHLEDIFEEIKSKGYNPLLAHPERYNYIDSLKEYQRLKGLGVRFQLNILSLDGAYGPGPRKKSMELLRRGMYDAYGSDLHRHHQFSQIRSMTLSSSLHAQLRTISTYPTINPR